MLLYPLSGIFGMLTLFTLSQKQLELSPLIEDGEVEVKWYPVPSTAAGLRDTLHGDRVTNTDAATPLSITTLSITTLSIMGFLRH